MNRNVCDHFGDYVDEFGLEVYNFVHACYSACVSNEARRRKVYMFFFY